MKDWIVVAVLLAGFVFMLSLPPPEVKLPELDPSPEIIGWIPEGVIFGKTEHGWCLVRP